MNDISGIDTLVDLFPNIPRSELASRLLCSSSVETLIEELLLEQASPETGSGYKDHVKNLKLMFPDLKLCDIAAELQRNSDDLEITIHSLMQPDPLGQLSQVMGLSQDTVKPYLTKHHNDFYRASADIVAHYRVQKRAWTSRVQDRKSAVLKDAYTFSENKNETKELNQYIWAETSLQHLNYDFLVKSLIFFQGDVFKVLELARLFIEAKKTSMTFEHNLGLEVRFAPKQDAQTTSEILKQTPQQKISKLPMLGDSNSAFSSMGATYNSGARKQPAIAPTLSNIGPTGASATPALSGVETTIDLHGYTVAEAKSITSSALETWWRQECEMRVADGLLHKHGAKADFVPPLVIITGRGLHSSGGPKIRACVLRILRDGKFIVNEDIGKVTVYGKRK